MHFHFGDSDIVFNSSDIVGNVAPQRWGEITDGFRFSYGAAEQQKSLENNINVGLREEGKYTWLRVSSTSRWLCALRATQVINIRHTRVKISAV